MLFNLIWDYQIICVIFKHADKKCWQLFWVSLRWWEQDKTINKNKNILIDDSHKNIEEKKFYIIYKNTASTMLKKKQESESILIMLMKEFELLIDVIIMNKITDCSMHVWLSVYFKMSSKHFSWSK